MQRIEDIKFSIPIKRHKTVKTGVSASIDTLGAHAILLGIMTGSIAQAQKFYFYHASASTTLAASGTAFGTLPTLTTAATASLNYAVLIEGQTAMKRYLIVLCSKQAASQAIYVTAHQFCNRVIPTNSVLGAAAPSGFTSLTRPLV